MSGTYQSDRILVRRPPGTRWYHRNQPLGVDFDRRWSIEGERRREKKKREKRGRYLLFLGSPRNSSPVGDFSLAGFLFPTLGDEARQEKGTRRRENRAMPRDIKDGHGYEIGSSKFIRLDNSRVLTWLCCKVQHLKATLLELDKNYTAQEERKTCMEL
ncbi:hypothetical protein BHE74_00005863 [Ensete ventricosum]|nr:hypothetical protein BHE74_00005863 [Ensete ventricosum]